MLWNQPAHIVAQQDNIMSTSDFFLQDLHTPKTAAAKSAASRAKHNAMAHMSSETYMLVYQQINWYLHEHKPMRQWLTICVPDKQQASPAQRGAGSSRGVCTCPDAR